MPRVRVPVKRGNEKKIPYHAYLEHKFQEILDKTAHLPDDNPKKFKILKHHFGQDSRRFKKMGYFGMAWYLVKNFWNRNNQDYWNRLDSSRYWD